ncbi:uncharacterized protein LOC111831068 [Capsella rubella]|uniref:uncharacterized protein LOC111831068 n=1 Tax=Capsella rubella TaxID=81985 RepID=UPI000CD57DB7|nr:uncharacterized protein LOC111831068 [Capsella rubella]
MAPPMILIQDAEGTLRDGDGHVRIAQGQKLNADETVILEPVAIGIERHQAGVDRHHVSADNAQLALNAEVEDENRTLGEYNRPALFYSNRSAIRPPVFQRNNFELKPGYYTLVGQHPFLGHTHEHPMDHIDKFEDLVSSIKAEGVSLDLLLCKLFQHSLAGEALSWLKELKPASLTSWKDVKVELLNNFYDDARSEELRKKISTFSQGISEAFKAAWVRFKGYQRNCPHHEYDKFQLLGIFYRGLDWRYQMALDAASNGNYNTRSPAQATKLIENLASSNSTKVADFERKKLAQNMDGVQLADVKVKLDSVHNLLVAKNSVKFAAEVEAFELGVDKEEGVNYKGTSSFVRTYGNSSYPSPPPPSTDTVMKSMLEQILAGQQNMTVDFNGKMDAMYTDLNGKIEALSTYTNKDGDDVWVEETSDDDKTALAQQVSPNTISRYRSTLTPVLVDSVPDRPISTAIDTSMSTPDHSVDRNLPSGDRHPLQTEPNFLETLRSSTEKIYKPKVPFPKPRKSKQEMEESRCKAMMEKRCVKRMVINDVSPEKGTLLARDMGVIFLKQTPQSNKEKNKEVFVSEKVSAMIQSRIPEKLPDPGSFVLDCSIFTERFPHSLCDLGMTDFKPTRISLILADRSKRIPEEPKDPIFLGRSFLATTGTLIDVQKGKIGLHVGDLVMNFDMDKLRRVPTIDGQTFSVEEAMGDKAVKEYS